MRRSLLLSTVTGILAGLCLAQIKSDPATLFAELQNPQTTNRAADQIVSVAKQDPATRQYVVEKLPGLIESTHSDLVSNNVVNLAGQLKAVSMVPTLIKRLPHSPADSGVLFFATAWSVTGDPVGLALCQIGDPAVPSLRDLLIHGDAATKVRVRRILWNIDTPASRKAIHEYLQSESDPHVKRHLRL